MNVNILVPGAGGFAAINVIKSLRKINFGGNIVATDSNPLSAGFYLSDCYYVLPEISDNNFINKAYEVITNEKINLILPTSGFDIIPYSKHRDELGKNGVTCFFSNYETIDICNNKFKFYEKIKKDFPTPEFSLSIEEVDEFPVFVKPVKGKGSRNTHLCNSKNELEFVFNKYQEMLVCEYLPGKEFTIDVLSDLNGVPICAIPRERIETKDGISFKGKVEKNNQMQEICMSLAGYIGIKGPSCMQMKQDKKGEFKFIEVNPRLGGGTIMATLAGVNIPSLILKLFKGIRIEPADIDFDEIIVLRYYEEIIVRK
jgi:carbamoyl-phosphate synthase large subunit